MLAQGKTMATGSASAGQALEFTVIPYGNGIAFDADSNVRESTSDYTIYTDGTKTFKKLIKNPKVFYGTVYNNGYAQVKISKSYFKDFISQGYVRSRFTVLGHSGNILRYCTVDLYWSYLNNLYYAVTQDGDEAYGQIQVTDDTDYIICKVNNPYCIRLTVLNDSDNIGTII